MVFVSLCQFCYHGVSGAGFVFFVVQHPKSIACFRKYYADLQRHLIEKIDKRFIFGNSIREVIFEVGNELILKYRFRHRITK